MVDYFLNKLKLIKLFDKIGQPFAVSAYTGNAPPSCDWFVVWQGQAKYARIEYYHKTVGTAKLNPKSGYKAVFIDTSTDNIIFNDATAMKYLRSPDITDREVPTSWYTNITESTLTFFSPLRYWYVPKTSRFTNATILKEQIKWLATNGVSGTNYPSEYRRPPYQAIYLNDLMQHVQPFGPTSHRSRL